MEFIKIIRLERRSVHSHIKHWRLASYLKGDFLPFRCSQSFSLLINFVLSCLILTKLKMIEEFLLSQ